MSDIFQKQNNELNKVIEGNVNISVESIHIDNVKLVSYTEEPSVTLNTQDDGIHLDFDIPCTGIEVKDVTSSPYEENIKLERFLEDRKVLCNFELSQKFSNVIMGTDVYDENEFIIGSWNGKHIYRKLIKINNVNPQTNIIDTLSIYDKIINRKGFVVLDDNTVVTIPYLHDSTYYIDVEITDTNQLALISYTHDIKEIQIAVDYIKVQNNEETTVHFHFPHTYSEEEQIVGTWIDGRPVYERTIVTTSSTLLKEPDIDVLIKVEGSVILNGAYYPLNIGTANRGSKVTNSVNASTVAYKFGGSYLVYAYCTASTGVVSVYATGWSFSKVFATLHYVKKSDLPVEEGE